MSTMRERMLAGDPYLAADPELAELRAIAQRRCAAFNATTEDDPAGRREALGALLGHVGEGVGVRPTLRCDYGSAISLGDRTFLNFDCVLLDVAPITVGADCQLAPGVQLVTATHPLDAAQRRSGWELGAPIVLEDDVWLGAGVLVLPGVRIGSGTVVGSGAVVTRDLPPNVVAVGNPARVLRPIGVADRIALPDDA